MVFDHTRKKVWVRFDVIGIMFRVDHLGLAFPCGRPWCKEFTPRSFLKRYAIHNATVRRLIDSHERLGDSIVDEHT
jgi:hypothetical protein